MNKRYFFLIIGILIISLVFAGIQQLQPTNEKIYDESLKKATIKNESESTIADIKLKTPINYYVLRGKDRKVAEFEINSYQDYESFLKKMELIDLKTNKNIEKNITYKYKNTYNVSVDKYKDDCSLITDKNGTKYNSCEKVYLGKESREKHNWIEFNEKSLLTKGNLTIGLFTDVNPGEKIEWIPTLFDVEINEWAVWTESFSVNLSLVYDFNSTEERVSGVYNLSYFQGTPTFLENTESLIGKFGNITINDNFNLIGSSATDLCSSPHTMMFWARSNDSIDTVLMDNVGGTIMMYMDVANEEFEITGLFETTFAQANNISKGWQHFVIATNETNSSVYINGTLYGTDGIGACSTNTGTVYIGTKDTGGDADAFHGKFDELIFFERELSATEILDYYNSSSGSLYVPATTPPNVTINSPINKTYSNQSIIFNVTALDSGTMDDCIYTLNGGIQNYTMSNLTGSIWNATNSSVNEGSFRVNYYCNDRVDNLNNSEFIDFKVLYIPPNVTINLPFGSLSSQTFDINITVENSSSVYCEYNITRGASLEIGNTQISNCKNTTATVSGDASYMISVRVNNTFNYFNVSNNSFTVSTGGGGLTPSGGGSTGTTIISESGEPIFFMQTSSGGTLFEYSMSSGWSKTKTILFENLGDSALTIDLSCEDDGGNLCNYVTFEEKSFNLPVQKEIKIAKDFYITFPDEFDLEEGVYTFNIRATDSKTKKSDVLTNQVNVEYGLSSFTGKLFTYFTIGDFRFNYGVLFLLTSIPLFVVSLIILKKSNLRILWGGLIGFGIATILVIFI